MEGTLRVLLAQVAPATHDVETNVAKACALLDAHPDADLAAFPELYLQAYALRGVEPIDLAVRGPLDPLFEAARRNRTAVVVGLAARTDEAEETETGVANSALCIDESGDVVACYRKVHLFGAEPKFFVPGDEYVLTQLAGVVTGILLCYDLEFPEPSRALASAGAQLLVTLSANMDPYADDHALFLRVRALENGVPHVYVNCVGQEGKLRFCGGSSVADATGRLVAQFPAYRPEVRVVEVPLGLPRRGRTSPHYLTDRRADLPVRAPAVR